MITDMKPQSTLSAGKDTAHKLTEANLQQDGFVTGDTYFASDQIRQEQAQLFQRSYYESLKDDTYHECNDNGFRISTSPTIAAHNATQRAWEGINLYKAPTPSTATPMERFCTVSPVNDPMPLLAKIAMQQAQTSIGSMDTLQSRTDAATVAAAKLLEVDDVEEAEYELPTKPFKCQPCGKVRTLRPHGMLKKRKRSSASDVVKYSDKRRKSD